MRVLVFGATGTIGRAVIRALAHAGHEALPIVRRADTPGALSWESDDALQRAAHAARPDAAISCLASRTGTPRDSWYVDHDRNAAALTIALGAGARTFVLLSAICVQRPKLPFQFAKLAFEETLRAAPLTHAIVRPTAYFKSLSGQVARVKAGKPFLVFGDGTLTATKPLSDADCAAFFVDCLTNPARFNQTLPIGGPGPAIMPLDQAAMLSAHLSREVPVRHVSPRLLSAIAGGLSVAGRVIPPLKEKAALAAIGHYYATQSMLVWDEATGRYDAEATPETGSERLADHYAALLSGTASADLGSHAVF